MSKWLPQKSKILPPVLLDRSTLENYSACPFMADALMTKQVQDISPMAETGKIVHAILAEGLEACGDNPDELAAWIEAEAQKSRPDLQPDVIQSIRGISQTLRHIRADRIVGIEKQYSTEFLFGNETRGPIILTTCMDLVLAGADETIIHIHDYKTGWKQRSNSDSFEAFQTQFLSWIMWRNLEKLQTVHFWYEQTRFGTRSYARLERERDYYNFTGRIQTALQLFLAGNKEAWPSLEKCSWCKATAICPQVIGEAKKLNDDPAAYLAQYIALTEGRVTEMEKTMKAHVKQHGNINYRGQFYGWQPPQRIIYGLHETKKD